MILIGRMFFALGRPINSIVIGVAVFVFAIPALAFDDINITRQPRLWPKHHNSQDLTTEPAFRELSNNKALDQIASNVERFPGQLVGGLGAPEMLKVIESAAFSESAIKTALFSNIDFLAAGHRLASLDAYIETIKKAIELGYANSGFPQTRVRVKLDTDHNSLVATVDEGTGFVAGPIEIIGALRVPTTQIITRLTEYFPPRRETTPAIIDTERPIGIFPGRFVKDAGGKIVAEEGPVWFVGGIVSFTERALTLIEERIRSVYADNGYFFAESKVQILTDGADGVARLVVEIISEGPRSVIDRIEITGNHRDSDFEILRLLEVAPADLLTRTDLRRFEQRLLDSARFSQVTFEQTVAGSLPPKIELHIEVVEWPEAPPLSADFSSAEKFFLDIRNWLARSLSAGSDLVFTTRGLNRDSAGRIVISQAGALVELLDTSAGSGRPVLTSTLRAGELALYSHWRERKIVQASLPSGKVYVDVSLSPINEPDSTNRSEISFGAAFFTGSEESFEFVKFNAFLSPAVFLLIAHQAEWTVSEEAGIKTAVSENLTIRIDATTGAVLEILGENSNRGLAALFSVKPKANSESIDFGIAIVEGAFQAALEKLRVSTGSYPNDFDAAAPWSSWIAMISQEMLAATATDYLAAILDDEDSLAERRGGLDLNARTRVAEIASRLITPATLLPLESAFAGVFLGRGEQGFSLSTTALSENRTLDSAGELFLYFSGLSLAINDRLLPRNSWAWTLIREFLFSINGNGFYFDREIAHLGNVQRAGPMIFLAIAKLFEGIGNPMSVHAAAFGLESMVSTHLDRDYRFLLERGSPLNETLEAVLASTAKLEARELDAMLETMPADLAQSFSGALDLSKKSVHSIRLEKFLPIFWQNYVAGLVTKKLQLSLDGSHIVDSRTQYALGLNFLRGIGTPQNDREAVKWFLRAAQQNHAEAQTALAKLYAQGRAGPQDYITAYMWLDIAARNGHAEAITLRGTLAGLISKQEITEAEKRASEWAITRP